jgi:hypothetical protein
MSHFTYMKTVFQNLFYLKKALNRLNIIQQEQEKIITNWKSEPDNKNLVIPQSNGYNIEFVWNKQEYELVVDMSFWKQPYPIEIFIDKITKEYAGEVSIGESQKIGFQFINSLQNIDGSNTLILEQWVEDFYE